MSNTLKKTSFLKNYGLLLIMLAAIVLGCIVGAVFPNTYDADGNLTSGA